jgi:hypothetical protein
MNIEKIKEKLDSILKETYSLRAIVDRSKFHQEEKATLDEKISLIMRENIDLNLPKKIKRYSDFDILLSELFINGIENFHLEDDFSQDYDHIEEEEGKEINKLFLQAFDILGDNYLYKRLSKFREKFIDLKYIYKVEWLEGYDKNKDQTPKIEYKSLHEMRGWNMEAYCGKDWVDQFKSMKVGIPNTIYVVAEKIRYTRIN